MNLCIGTLVIFMFCNSAIFGMDKLSTKIHNYHALSTGEQCANTNVVDSNGTTPLIRAIRNNRFDDVSYLLNNGADPSKNIEIEVLDFAPITFAVLGENVTMVETLLARGVNPNIHMNTGASLLCSSLFQYKSIEIAKLLIKHGADVNDNKSYWRLSPPDVTLLHRAAMDDDKEIITLLLEHGANKAVVDSDGKKPGDYAKNPDIKALLE